MKLLDLLKQELKEWPEGMFYAVQDCDGDVKFGSKSSKCDAFFDGGVWLRGNDGNEVTMIFNELSCDYKTSKVTKEQWEDAKQGTTQSKHKHAEMIAMCAKFAQTMDDPMSMFQYLDSESWHDFNKDASIIFYNHAEYRLKPKTKLINGVEIPDLSFTPKIDENYFVVDLTLSYLYDTYMCLGSNYNHTKLLVERGLVYPCTEEGKQAAILHAKALLNIKGE